MTRTRRLARFWGIGFLLLFTLGLVAGAGALAAILVVLPFAIWFSWNDAQALPWLYAAGALFVPFAVGLLGPDLARFISTEALPPGGTSDDGPGDPEPPVLPPDAVRVRHRVHVAWPFLWVLLPACCGFLAYAAIANSDNAWPAAIIAGGMVVPAVAGGLYHNNYQIWWDKERIYARAMLAPLVFRKVPDRSRRFDEIDRIDTGYDTDEGAHIFLAFEYIALRAGSRPPVRLELYHLCQAELKALLRHMHALRPELFEGAVLTYTLAETNAGWEKANPGH